MTVQAGPPVTQLPIAEVAPKRGPGRPKGSGNKHRNNGSAAPRPPRPSTSLRTRVGGMLTFVNMFVMVTPIRGDALDPIEIDALAKAIDEQCKQSPRFRKYVESMLSAGSGGQLLGVCIVIGARRAARHGVLPPDMDGYLGGMLAQEASRVGTPPASDDTPRG